MRILPALLLSAAVVACGAESVSPDELDFRLFDVAREDGASPPDLEATATVGTVHLSGVLPMLSCNTSAIVEATRREREVTLVLHTTVDMALADECPFDGPYLGYEAFVHNVPPGKFSVAVVYTSKLQNSTAAGEVTIDVP